MNTLPFNTTRNVPALESYDLLPPTFRSQIRVRQVLGSWLTIIVALVAALLGVIAATAFRRHQNRNTNEQIASAAIPLMDLRSDVIKLQEENIQRSQWCRLVESARPDDSALQALAAVAVASQNGNREILIDSIHLRLPLEFPETAEKTPDWATPLLAITARPKSNEVVQAWLDRLNSFDRIGDASVVARDDGQAPQRTPAADQRPIEFHPLQLTATPVATRVVP